MQTKEITLFFFLKLTKIQFVTTIISLFILQSLFFLIQKSINLPTLLIPLITGIIATIISLIIIFKTKNVKNCFIKFTGIFMTFSNLINILVINLIIYNYIIYLTIREDTKPFNWNFIIVILLYTCFSYWYCIQVLQMMKIFYEKGDMEKEVELNAGSGVEIAVRD